MSVTTSMLAIYTPVAHPSPSAPAFSSSNSAIIIDTDWLVFSSTYLYRLFSYLPACLALGLTTGFNSLCHWSSLSAWSPEFLFLVWPGLWLSLFPWLWLLWVASATKLLLSHCWDLSRVRVRDSTMWPKDSPSSNRSLIDRLEWLEYTF